VVIRQRLVKVVVVFAVVAVVGGGVNDGRVGCGGGG
jgi:hypothetical protein